jgi:chromatin remodeling complex protein RSC6
MSTVDIETTDAPKAEFSSVDAIKNMINTVNEQINANKSLLSQFKTLLKETEKNSKELEKLRNKRSSKTKTPRSPDALPSGITKPVAISDELAKFLGVAPGTLVPRNEVTKGVSGFVKGNELSDPTNKQKFILDDRPAAKTLRALLGNPSEDVTYFNLQRYLKHHYITDVAAPAPVAKAAPTPAAPVATGDVQVVKKKILVKKPKPAELKEEA